MSISCNFLSFSGFQSPKKRSVFLAHVARCTFRCFQIRKKSVGLKTCFAWKLSTKTPLKMQVARVCETPGGKFQQKVLENRISPHNEKLLIKALSIRWAICRLSICRPAQLAFQQFLLTVNAMHFSTRFFATLN